jgi:phosphatidylglycerophosphatase A
MNKIALALATWFGCGYCPKGPGTAGSLGALLVAWPLIQFCGWTPLWFGVLAIAATPAGMWASDRTARIKNTEDPQIVVVDEVLGQWLTLAGAARLDLAHVAVAFLLFRLFDIIKPWPVNRLEALPGGVGIVADDLMAGVYGALVLVGLRFMVQF